MTIMVSMSGLDLSFMQDGPKKNETREELVDRLWNEKPDSRGKYGKDKARANKKGRK